MGVGSSVGAGCADRPEPGAGGGPHGNERADSVWRVPPGGRPRAVARGLALDRPDGMVLDGSVALVSTFGAHRIERVGATLPDGGQPVVALPAGKVDGLRRLPDGALAVTSWDARAVWRLSADGATRPLLRDVTSPAGVAVDTRRHRLAVTSLQEDALYLLPLP